MDAENVLNYPERLSNIILNLSQTNFISNWLNFAL